MLLATIFKKYKVIDSNGNNKTIYGNGQCFIVIKNDEDRTVICFGENAGKYLDINSDTLIRYIEIEELFKAGNSNNLEVALENVNEMFKSTFFEVKNQRTSTINDPAILNQIEEIKENDGEQIILKDNSLPKISDIYKQITSSIICQDEQVKRFISAIYNNLILNDMNLDRKTIAKLKQNILITGPTGVGKTEMIRQIESILKIPVVIEDSTRFTEAGYVGADIDDVYAHLLNKAGNDLELAQRGILVFDEFDKLANATPDGNDVGKTSVQQSILTMLEGNVVNFDVKDGSIKRKLQFDTSKLTVIGLGAFAGIESIRDKRCKLDKSPMGFKPIEINEQIAKPDYIIDDYIKYGMMAEVMGRFGQIIQMNELDKDCLKRIIVESDSSILLLKKMFYDKQGINLKYDEKFIDKLVSKASEYGCGARSLNAILNQIFSDGQYDSFDGEYTDFILTEETVEDSKKYILK